MIRYPIETPRLLLRPFELEDAEELFAFWGDPEAGYFGGDWPAPTSVAETGRMLEPIVRGQVERGFGMWAVVERTTGELVGNCGLFLMDGVGPDVELAYAIRPDRRRRGYASEAAGAAVRAGFEQLGVERIVADLDPANEPSVRVLEGLGFQPDREEPGKRHYALERR